jgi:hypothetical protein
VADFDDNCRPVARAENADDRIGLHKSTEEISPVASRDRDNDFDTLEKL